MENVFLLTVNSFWYGTVYVAKQIRRRELWIDAHSKLFTPGELNISQPQHKIMKLPH
jgi:hypothetical protein